MLFPHLLRPVALCSSLLAVVAFAPQTLEAEITVIYGDFARIGRIEAPPAVGDLEATSSVAVTEAQTSIARLPSGELLAVGLAVHRIDPATLELTQLADPDVFCADVTADADGNLWCVLGAKIHCLNAGSYDLAWTAEHATLWFGGIAFHQGRLLAIAYEAGVPAGDPMLVEVDPQSGDVSMLRSYVLPQPPEDQYFIVASMDFDDGGTLWLGLGAHLPVPILPPPPEGYVARVVDPFGGGVVRPAQRLEGATDPGLLVLGSPLTLAIPTVDSVGLATLAALLAAAAFLTLRRRSPIEADPD